MCGAAARRAQGCSEERVPAAWRLPAELQPTTSPLPSAPPPLLPRQVVKTIQGVKGVQEVALFSDRGLSA